MDRTIKTVVDSLFARLESLSTYSHPGWHESPSRQRDRLTATRYRIIDVLAGTYEENRLPDAVAYTHGHTIYRIDFVEGNVKPIGEMVREMPDDSALMLEAV
jgi:hypothetical protein